VFVHTAVVCCRLPFLDGKKREVTTIYELVKSPKKFDDRIMYVAPRYQFKVDNPKMPCQPTTTVVPRFVDTSPGLSTQNPCIPFT
jgi:hypothetical protein